MKNIKKNNIASIKTFEYYSNANNTDSSIVEMARIGEKEASFPYDVFVYGGDSYGSGRNEHGEPHFHFSDNIKGGGKYSFSVLIPTPSDWAQSKDLIISESNNDNYDWKGLRKEKKTLIIWLDKPNNLFANITNLEYIRGQWNTLNADNKNVKKTPMK